ncbi:MAG: hypothetical protein ACREBV_00865, partial [Candidatus Zixiibacteriota bacterium]
QSSNNYGVTFNPKVNVTQTDTLVDDWTPSHDMDGLWTGEPPNEELHLVWNTWHFKRFRDEGFFPFSSRVFHWSESYPGLGLGPRPVMSRIGDPVTCNAAIFNLNLSKVSVAQCNGYLYVLAADNWEAHDDPLNPDCAQRAYDGDGAQAVNGEIVVAISDNNGVSWDLDHNLTNTPTPHCDSVGGAVGPCDCDYYPSTIPHGVATRSGDDFTITTKINPRPAVSYPDGVGVEWLDVQYVNDLDPGPAAGNAPAGMWTNSPIRHFRMACVPPDQIPVWNASIAEIAYPTFVKPTQIKDIDITIENTGNSPLNQSISVEEDTGPSGWLTAIGIATFIDEGANNTDDGIIRLNASSITQAQVNTAGGSLVFYGRVLFDSDAPSDVDTIPVTFIVTDTVRLPSWDTISTGVISLAVANNGQFGGGSDGGGAGVHMDYFNDPAECDTVDSIPGATEVYLYDGSFAVGGVVGPDTIMANTVFSQGIREESSVYPTVDHTPPTIDGVIQTWTSGKLVNNDSNLAFNVRWVVPRVTMTWGSAANKTWYADQQFVTRELKVWPNDGLAHNGLAIGDVTDWDVPSDSGSDNKGPVESTRRLLYSIGGEYDQDNALECQENDYRYGGVAFGYLKAYWDHDNNGVTSKKWTIRDSLGYGGYNQSNSRYVYTGWDDDELYANMEAATGYVPWAHGHPDSQQVDLHSVITGAFDYDLAAGDTAAIYTVYASVRMDASKAASDRIKDLALKGRNFTYYFTCCRGTRGDLNGDGTELNVLDLTFAVDRIFRGGTAASCPGEADVNRDKSILDVLDLTFCVDRIFRSGPASSNCGTAPTP